MTPGCTFSSGRGRDDPLKSRIIPRAIMIGTVVVVWIFLLILVVVTLFAGVKTVSQGQVWTVERFGAYTRMLQPGLNFVLPYVDRVGRKLNVQEQVVEIPEQSVITRDNATVLVD